MVLRFNDSNKEEKTESNASFSVSMPSISSRFNDSNKEEKTESDPESPARISPSENDSMTLI